MAPGTSACRLPATEATRGLLYDVLLVAATVLGPASAVMAVVVIGRGYRSIPNTAADAEGGTDTDAA